MEKKLSQIKKASAKVKNNNKLKIKIVTRSWKTHNQSNLKDPLQDFVSINKVAVTMRAHNHSVNIQNLLKKSLIKILDKQLTLENNCQKEITKEEFIFLMKNLYMEREIELPPLLKILLVMIMPIQLKVKNTENMNKLFIR